MIFVTYCSKTKTGKEKGFPHEIYGSQRIKSFHNRFPEPKGYLSHLHGFIQSHNIIENYDLGEFLDWENCVNQVRESLQDEQVIFYSPRPLVESPWLKLLNEAGVKFSIIRSYRELRQN